MNVFLKILESAFDDYFHEQYPNLSVDNPKYLDVYKDELQDFCDFLLEEWQKDRETL